MKIPGWNTIRTAAGVLPLLLTGCVVVPDSGEVYHSGYRAPAYSAGYYTNYGSGHYGRPLAPTYYISRPPPAVVVRPPPVVVVSPPRPHAFGHHGFDRPSHGHGWHAGPGVHRGHDRRHDSGRHDSGRRDGDRGHDRGRGGH